MGISGLFDLAINAGVGFIILGALYFLLATIFDTFVAVLARNRPYRLGKYTMVPAEARCLLRAALIFGLGPPLLVWVGGVATGVIFSPGALLILSLVCYVIGTFVVMEWGRTAGWFNPPQPAPRVPAPAQILPPPPPPKPQPFRFASWDDEEAGR